MLYIAAIRTSASLPVLMVVYCLEMMMFVHTLSTSPSCNIPHNCHNKATQTPSTVMVFLQSHTSVNLKHIKVEYRKEMIYVTGLAKTGHVGTFNYFSNFHEA